MTTVGLIWSQSTSGVIGRNGGIPWRLPEDLARFKEITLGHPVVMGRLTWESLPQKVRPLPGRKNLVLTRRADYLAEGAQVVTSLDDALGDDALGDDVLGDDVLGDDALGDDALGDEETWVIGGERIYTLALTRAARCEVTEVDVELHRQDADAVAPVLGESWVGVTGEWLTSASGLRYRFHSYRRARP